MSRQADEAKSRKPREKGGQARKSGIVSVKLNKQQTEDLLRRREAGEIDPCSLITELTERGISISIRYHVDRGAASATARETAAKWGEGVAISAWHQDAERALLKLTYALIVMHPDYPDQSDVPTQYTFEDF